jgi:hypothetical protein
MLKSILKVILGLSEIITIIVFSVVYGGACIFFGWYPEIPFKTWALITGFFSLTVIILSFGLWCFTSFKEIIHSWILLPGIFVGKAWISYYDNSFASLLSGSIVVSLIFIILVLSEAVRSWFSVRSPKHK